MKQKERVSWTRITGHTGVRIDDDLYEGDYKNPLILDVSTRSTKCTDVSGEDDPNKGD